MKIFFFIIVSLILLEGCGKKSDPEYLVKILLLLILQKKIKLLFMFTQKIKLKKII